MMTVSRRVLAVVSAVGLTVTLASCDLGGGSGSKDSGASTSASALAVTARSVSHIPPVLTAKLDPSL